MNVQDIYLLCFAVGALWSFGALLLGGLHAGSLWPGHIGHGHIGHGHIGHGHIGHGHPHIAHDLRHGTGDLKEGATGIGELLNPSCGAAFLAWFGGVGFLLARHTGLGFWAGFVIASALGLGGAWILAWFLRFLNSRERPLDPADYEMVGVLGRISCSIRAGGTGEMIYVRDGTRRSLSARSEDGQEIGRGEEVVVTRYEKGIAYVSTWEAMTQ
jgi:membrane protein implicated in regulation of membrane protease activity